ncbi:GNAT family N-acetyltransferase [Bacillus sp. FJAT-26377]|nr:GNAT family N-acetyltransferase [Bacillus sp. FJAT-26377]
MNKSLTNNIKIKNITEEDLYNFWNVKFNTGMEWKKWDAPYFPIEKKSYEEFLKEKDQYINKENRKLIEINGEVVGTVSYYWEHKESLWLEAGISIYDYTYWGNGNGKHCLIKWINYLFNNIPLVRIGLTTWSGNEKMINLGLKLGFQIAGRLRKCRLHEGKYYDSIRMGILRAEWEELKEDVY